MRLKLYRLSGCYQAQIEAWAIVGLRLGFSAWGVAYWPRERKRMPRWMPHVTLAIWNHTGQCDQRWVFRLNVGRYRFGYRTRGDAKPTYATYYDAGWRLGRG
jgi:hypothetical protein